MLLFWANIDEADIEGFAGTLLLPSYMSHLTLSPFRIIDQPHNFDGQQSLILTYVGQGRVEQLAVSPQKYALSLLRYAVPILRFDSIRLLQKSAIWNWELAQAQDSPSFSNQSSSSYLRQETSKNVLELEIFPASWFRIYFETVFRSLQLDFKEDYFSPFQTYVSVSRKEMFIGSQILAAYFYTWIGRLLGKEQIDFKTQKPFDELQKMNSQKNHKKNLKSQLTNDRFILDLTANRVRFSMQNLGGEWSVEEDEVFYDLLEFTGLKSSLQEIEQYAVPDLTSPKTQIGEVGILFQLTEPQ